MLIYDLWESGVTLPILGQGGGRFRGGAETRNPYGQSGQLT